MALIKCPDCKKEVSDKAYSCPNCGYPIDQIAIINYREIQETEIKDFVVGPLLIFPGSITT